MEVQKPDVFIAMQGISKAYPGVQALSNVDFSIHSGEILALVGENGAGKSTLMRILAGASRPDAGSIVADGREVTFDSTAAAHSLGISTIYQELMLIPDLSVLENVYLGHLRENRWGMLDWSGMRRDAGDLLSRLGYAGSLDTPVCELSVAEQQLVEIAKALTRKCRLLIMDEPTAPLNREEVEHFFDIVRGLQASGLSIVFITHHLNEIFEICHRVVVLRQGERVGEAMVSELSESRLVELMLGRTMAHGLQSKRSIAHLNAKIALDVQAISTPDLLKDVSFSVHKGEVVGLAGLMGSGRTEILRVLYGVDKPSAGTIKIDGEPVMFSGPREALAGGVGLGPEDRKSEGLVLSMPIRFNATLASMDRYSGTFAILKGKEAARVKALCERLEVKYNSIEDSVGKLSGGNQQKIILARLLDADVDIFLLDEPTRGIDIGAKEAIFELVRELADKGAAVVFVSSVIEELLRVCDSIVCLNLGRVTGVQQREDFSMPQIMLNVMGSDSDTLGNSPDPASLLA
ncbi:MAG: sugar ABC transporter ATP-binding protein [Roseitalea sp.]|nr:sugar ABC transporter ATP-binding protein [Roseitalea sp.]MBO6722677.1 sugar ABC transporter ATP-binding protein [Roseitalea sp.]MBO6741539.1 sugar ABC transporter ATP-binding protein [Roseitalea sp.]